MLPDKAQLTLWDNLDADAIVDRSVAELPEPACFTCSFQAEDVAVLHLLLLQAGKLVPKARLISEVFGLDDAVGPNALELYIARLRKKLGAGGLRIRTIRGLGYMLEKD